MKLGKVDSLWRYPVKSLIGEQLTSFTVDARGVIGDRFYAISNAEGKFGSGKNTTRFRRIDGLFSLSAATVEEGVSIKFPDGDVLSSNNESLNSKLSQVLGESVTLTKEQNISHFDDGSVHILTTASLTALHDLLPESGIDLRRFRPNIVLTSDYLDEELVGKTITIGEVTLEVTHKTERCRMITLEQSDLDNQPNILKVVSKHFSLDFGVYAKLISTGDIAVGDEVEIS